MEDQRTLVELVRLDIAAEEEVNKHNLTVKVVAEGSRAEELKKALADVTRLVGQLIGASKEKEKARRQGVEGAPVPLGQSVNQRRAERTSSLYFLGVDEGDGSEEAEEGLDLRLISGDRSGDSRSRDRSAISRGDRDGLNIHGIRLKMC